MSRQYSDNRRGPRIFTFAQQISGGVHELTFYPYPRRIVEQRKNKGLHSSSPVKCRLKKGARPLFEWPLPAVPENHFQYLLGNYFGAPNPHCGPSLRFMKTASIFCSPSLNNVHFASSRRTSSPLEHVYSQISLVDNL